jgi:acyl-CoA thioesterase YciA
VTDIIPTGQRAESLAKAWEAAEWPHEAPVLRAIAMPSDTNPEGDIFGGWLLSQMDLAAASVAPFTARPAAAPPSPSTA